MGTGSIVWERGIWKEGGHLNLKGPLLTTRQRTGTRKGVVAHLPAADADGGARPTRRGRGGPMSVGAVHPGQGCQFGSRAGSPVQFVCVDCILPVAV